MHRTLSLSRRPRRQKSTKNIAKEATPPDAPEDKQTGTGIIEIGLALGSPTHPHTRDVAPWEATAMVPRAAVWAESREQKVEERDSSGGAALQEPPAAKSRKWGLFGRSKSKIVKEPAMRPKRSMAESNVGARKLPDFDATGRKLRAGTVVREEDAKQKYRPIIIRSQTEEPAGTAEAASTSEMVAPPATKSDESNQQQEERAKSVWGYTESPPSPSKHGDWLMGVDIPSIEMERYSVMFGSVLGRRPPSSLLARRQARLSRLQAISDHDDESEEAKKNSKQRRHREQTVRAVPSPSFALFPPSPATPQSFSARPSSRARANTSPALLPSPRQASFRHHAGTDDQTQLPRLGNSVYKPPPVQTVAKDERPARKPPQKMAKNNALVKVTTGSVASDTTGSIKSTSTPSTSPGSTSPPVAQSSEPVDNHANGYALHDAVEVSIARQISVSREQRRLLLPLQNATPRRRAGSAAAAAAAAAAVDGDERVAGAKSSKPKVVHPESDGGGQLAPRSMHRHQKSERVVLESA